MEFRKDINGLRFIAVSLVLCSHLGINFLSNGFIGVDIFFVISGFLITGLLNKKLNIQDILVFIKKRCKRILPNLFLISFLIFIFSFLLIPKYLLKEIFINFYSSIFGFSNYAFMSQAQNYFAPTSNLNPFLHLWSLSIEIQFYIFFLFLFFVLNFFSTRFKFFIVLLISLASLLLSVDLSNIEHFYFFTPIRIFEFGIGSLIFLLNLKITKNKQNYLIFIFILLLSTSLLFIDKSNSVPGFQIIFPCLAAAIFLLTGSSSVNLFLGSDIFNYLGKISYLIYLVHWPLLVFAGFYFESSPLNKFIIFILTMLFSIFFYHFYEIKTRYNKLYYNIFLLIFIFFILIIFLLKDNILHKNFKNSNEYQALLLKERIKRDAMHQKLDEYDITKKKSNKFDSRILILGDSHADDIFFGFSDKNYMIGNKKIARLRIDTICYNFNHKRPILSKIINSKIGTCESQQNNLYNFVNKNSFDTVIVVNHWNEKNIDYASALFNFLNRQNLNKIIIVGTNETFNQFDTIFNYSRDYKSLNMFFFKDKKNNKDFNTALKFEAKKNNFLFFDRALDFCNISSSTCSIIDQYKNINYIDQSHYAVPYSIFVSNLLKDFITK